MNRITQLFSIILIFNATSVLFASSACNKRSVVLPFGVLKNVRIKDPLHPEESYTKFLTLDRYFIENDLHKQIEEMHENAMVHKGTVKSLGLDCVFNNLRISGRERLLGYLKRHNCKLNVDSRNSIVNYRRAIFYKYMEYERWSLILQLSIDNPEYFQTLVDSINWALPLAEQALSHRAVKDPDADADWNSLVKDIDAQRDI